MISSVNLKEKKMKIEKKNYPYIVDNVKITISCHLHVKLTNGFIDKLRWKVIGISFITSYCYPY